MTGSPNSWLSGYALLIYVRVSSSSPSDVKFVRTVEYGAANVNLYGGTPPETVIPHGSHVFNVSVTLAVTVKSDDSCSLIQADEGPSVRESKVE